MKILKVENSKKSNGIIVKAILGQPEFKQLNGNLSNLCVFAIDEILERASLIKTGASHNRVKYVLFPKALRRKVDLRDMDGESLRCGIVGHKESVYLVYRIGRKGSEYAHL